MIHTRKKRSIEEPFTFINQNGTQNSNSTTAVLTTSIILTSSKDEVIILIINGNVSIEPDYNNTAFQKKKKKRENSNKQLQIGDIPLLLISANPTTGNLISIEATTASDNTFIDTGIVVTREILVNLLSENEESEKKREYQTQSERCANEENIGGTVFCPKIEKTVGQNGPKYRKEYSTKRAKRGS